MDWELIRNSVPFLLKGIVVTLQLSAIIVVIGSVLGFFAGLAMTTKNKLLKFVVSCYADFFRGTPVIVQLFIVYFAVPSLLDINIEPFSACVIAYALNSGAYMTEVVRGGIKSIDKGQTEAGKSLGLNGYQIMLHIVLPQAIKRILPAMGNEFIGVIKGTSIVSVIGMRELTREGQLIIARTYATFEIWTAVAFFYLVIVIILSRLLTFAERRLND
jgi:polar amino acid transport system permease protein